MLIFDAAERAMCTVKRQATSTPLQSLVLLNDLQYIETSRVLAENLINNDNEPSTWIKNAFKSIVSRNSSSAEIEILTELYESELQRFKEDENSALDLINIGEALLSTTADKNILAALTVVVSAIINMDEAKHF
jgi:hypothetical protein